MFATMRFQAEIILLKALLQEKEVTSDSKSSAKLTKLQAEILAAFDKRVLATLNAYRIGTVRVDEVLRSYTDSLEAGLKIAKTDEARSNLFKQQVKDLEKLEIEIQAKHDVRAQGGRLSKLLHCRASRQSAQFRLLQLQQTMRDQSQIKSE